MSDSNPPTGSDEQPPQENIIGDDDSQAGDNGLIEVSLERAEQLLNTGEIIEDHGRVRWSSNYTLLITVRDGDLQTLAVYKPQRGERPLWDFPDGTLCYREVAAYEVSKALGWDIVAPTVIREASAGIGSVQLFIEHDPRITYFQLSDDFIPELQRMAAFDDLVNNTDRKGGHCLIDANGKLWGIDHGICFHTHSKLRTVIWDFAGQPVPDDLLADVEALCGQLDDEESEINIQLQTLLNPREIRAFRTRVERFLSRRTYPIPGPGPNYPWPAV